MNKSTNNVRAQFVLENELGLCEECVRLLIRPFSYQPTDHEGEAVKPDCCPLCFGILSSKEKNKFHTRFLGELNKAFDPYGGLHMNYISKDAPTIVLPPLMMVRAQCILGALSNNVDECDLKPVLSHSNAIDICNEMKKVLRQNIRQWVQPLRQEQCTDSCNMSSTTSNTQIPSLPKSLHKEEAGYMNYHVVITAPSSTLHFLVPPSNVLSMFTREKKRNRKRFRGNDPIDKQGGNPRTNLENRIKEKIKKNGYNTSSGNRRMDNNYDKDCQDSDTKIKQNSNMELELALFDKMSIQNIIQDIGSQMSVKKRLGEWIMENSAATSLDKQIASERNSLCGIHVSCWRNHFYIEGRYTKSKRDISQTPFYVPCSDEEQNDTHHSDYRNIDDSKKMKTGRGMKKLGRTSVEEEICQPISSIACHGISRLNNESLSLSGFKGELCSENSKGDVVYGMCKFHASGREDMDVRMILPLTALSSTNTNITHSKEEQIPPKALKRKSKIVGSGRPFVCEVIDAYRMPVFSDLQKAVRVINSMDDNDHLVDAASRQNIIQVVDDKEDFTTRKWVDEVSVHRQYVQYGRNPRGVGVSGLQFAKSSSFKNLQSETENKVKLYGCLCWSENEIPSQKFLDERLVQGKHYRTTTTSRLESDTQSTSTIYPLKIEQCTPLRVLHRRAASVRERYILTLEAKRIDKHWFRLHLSTSAGTYVKEFCHGDCARTYPSISTLLEGKTDIVTLDCEGIAV